MSWPWVSACMGGCSITRVWNTQAVSLARAFPARARLPQFLVLPIWFQSRVGSGWCLGSSWYLISRWIPMEAESPGTFGLATQ